MKVFHDIDTGRIVGFGSSAPTCDVQVMPDVPEIGSVTVDDGQQVDVQDCYVANGEVIERPQTGLPAAHTLAQGEDWTVPNVPDGTRVYVDGEDLGVTDPLGLALSFAAPGLWQVSLDPPWPWQPASCEVTVS